MISQNRDLDFEPPSITAIVSIAVGMVSWAGVGGEASHEGLMSDGASLIPGGFHLLSRPLLLVCTFLSVFVSRLDV